MESRDSREDAAGAAAIKVAAIVRRRGVYSISILEAVVCMLITMAKDKQAVELIYVTSDSPGLAFYPSSQQLCLSLNIEAFCLFGRILVFYIV